MGPAGRVPAATAADVRGRRQPATGAGPHGAAGRRGGHGAAARPEPTLAGPLPLSGHAG